MMIPERVIERVKGKVVVEDGCHLSLYSAGSHGYSQIGWNEQGIRHVTVGHRVAWIGANGPIPEGMTVDHTCRNRKCVNVAHLRLLSNVKNASDNGMATRTHCPLGHEYSGENLRTYTNPITEYTSRFCKECQRLSDRRRRHVEPQ